MSYEELEKSLYVILDSNVKLIELNKKLRVCQRQPHNGYKNESDNLNEKITNIDIEKAKID